MGSWVYLNLPCIYLVRLLFSLPSVHVGSTAAVRVTCLWILTAVTFVDLFLLTMLSIFQLLWIRVDSLVLFTL